MNKLWMQIFVLMIVGSIAKSVIHHVLVWVAIDIAILAIAYLILRRHSNVNINSSMLFLGGLTIVSVLTDLKMVSDMTSGILMLALLGLMMYLRRRNNNPQPQANRHKWNK